MKSFCAIIGLNRRRPRRFSNGPERGCVVLDQPQSLCAPAAGQPRGDEVCRGPGGWSGRHSRAPFGCGSCHVRGRSFRCLPTLLARFCRYEPEHNTSVANGLLDQIAQPANLAAAFAKVRALAWALWATPDERRHQLIARGLPGDLAYRLAQEAKDTLLPSQETLLAQALSNAFFAQYGLAWIAKAKRPVSASLPGPAQAQASFDLLPSPPESRPDNPCSRTPGQRVPAYPLVAFTPGSAANPTHAMPSALPAKPLTGQMKLPPAPQSPVDCPQPPARVTFIIGLWPYWEWKFEVRSTWLGRWTRRGIPPRKEILTHQPQPFSPDTPYANGSGMTGWKHCATPPQSFSPDTPYANRHRR